MPFWWQQLREEISPAQVIPYRDLRPPPPTPPRTLLLMQPVRTLGKGCLNPWPPTKACPTCGQWGHWKMDCSQGHPRTTGEVPIFQTWRVEYPQGCPGALREIPTSPQNPSPTLGELFQWRGPGSSPPAHVPDTSSELRVDEVVARKKTSFIVDTGATFSPLTSYSGPTQDSELTIKGVSGVPLRPKISPPLLCQFGKSTLRHSFLIMIQCPMALLGRDLVSKLGVFITIPLLDTVSIFCMQITPGLSPSLTPDLPLDPPTLDPQVWDTDHTSIAKHYPLNSNHPTTVLPYPGGPQGT